LAQASMKLGEMAYRKAQEEAAANGETPEGEDSAETAKSEDDVVDADFTEVEDDKK
jgi:molecular chaperone DnaK